jgi:hypothetical protein
MEDSRVLNIVNAIMSNPHIKKKLYNVLIASICGAILFSLIGFMDTWIQNSYDAGAIHKWFTDLIFGVIQFACLILDLITTSVMSTIGFHTFNQESVIIQCIVNALDGAVMFGLVAMFWQFIVKEP